jgi:hypothetical protein
MRNRVFAGLAIAGTLLFAGSAQSKDLREIELRRLFEPTPAELRWEREGRIYIYEGLREEDIARALREQFNRAHSMMFIRVQPSRAPSGSGDAATVYYQDDGC